MLTDYTWLVVLSACMAFFSAWGIGANDLANSFGTSVGSHTLKIWQACLIASVFEFLGAFFLGSTVTDTISSKISNTKSFANAPELFMYGMAMVDAASGLWVLLATYLELPVSTTHSVIGAIIGFSLVNAGLDGVLWAQKKPDFPYYDGFVPVVISWFTSPLLAGLAASLLFFILRLVILRRRRSLQLACLFLPLILFGVIFLNVEFVLTKGAKFLIDQENKPYKDECRAELRGAWYNATGSNIPPSQLIDWNTFQAYPPTGVALQPPVLYMDGSKVAYDNTSLASLHDVYTTALQQRCNVTQQCINKPATWHDAFVEMGVKGRTWKAVDVNFNTTIPGTTLACPYMSGKYMANQSDPAWVASGSLFNEAEAYCCRKVDVWDHNGLSSAEGAAALAAGIVCLLAYLYLFFYLRPRIDRMLERDRLATERRIEAYRRQREHKTNGLAEAPAPATPDPPAKWTQRLKQRFVRIVKRIFTGMHFDIHAVASNESETFDPTVGRIHDLAEVFDPKTEKLFEYLQVFSACAMSFSHGSNDVANAVGPLAGCWAAYKLTRIMPKSPQMNDDMKWILALGGAGIVLGLSTYGHIIMRGLGVKVAKITPTRGFCIETASAATVITASAFGLPISTTNCVVGATAGVGMMEGARRGVNWRYLGRTFLAWIFTVVITGTICAALYAQGVYAPSVHAVRDRPKYQSAIGTHVNLTLTGLTSIVQLQTANASLQLNDTSLASLYNVVKYDNLWLNEYFIAENKNDLTPEPLKNPVPTDYRAGSGQFTDTGYYYKVALQCRNYTTSSNPYDTVCNDRPALSPPYAGQSFYLYFRHMQYFTASDQATLLGELDGLMGSIANRNYTVT